MSAAASTMTAACNSGLPAMWDNSHGNVSNNGQNSSVQSLLCDTSGYFSRDVCHHAFCFDLVVAALGYLYVLNTRIREVETWCQALHLYKKLWLGYFNRATTLHE